VLPHFAIYIKIKIQVKEDEMGGEFSIHGGDEKHKVGFWWESQMEGDHYKDLDVHGKIILKWILGK
jgi:hypothetical protein